MIFLLLVYLAVLFLLIRFRLVTANLFWKTSPLIWLLILNVALFIPMGWGAPSGRVIVARHSVQVVPDVAGEVIDVPVTANTPLKAGDILFRIDDVPFKAQVDALDAQLEFAELRRKQMGQLQAHDAGRLFDVQQRESEVKQLKAQLTAAQWNLDKTVVRAPADGYVTNLALRKGARVANLPLSPVMAFIDTSETIVATEIPQIYARYIAPNQKVELTFKLYPGQIFTAQVDTVLQAVSTGQINPSGLAVTPSEVKSAPFVVRLKLEDEELAKQLPAGATGDAAIFTDHAKSAHVIRRVMLRLTAFLNYVNPF